MGDSEVSVIYCSKCGQQNPGNNYQCSACGNLLHAARPAPVKPVEEDEGPPIGERAGMRMLLPVGRSGWAIAAGYLGLASIFLGLLGPMSIVFGIAAIVMSIVAIIDMKKNPHRHGTGRAVFGIIGGVAGMVLYAIHAGRYINQHLF